MSLLILFVLAAIALLLVTLALSAIRVDLIEPMIQMMRSQSSVPAMEPLNESHKNELSLLR